MNEELKQILSKLDGMSRDINELKSGQARMEERITSTDERITSIEERVTSTDERVTSMEERVTSTDERITSIEERVTSTDERVTSMDEKITSMDERLNRMDENIEELKTGQKVLTDGQRGLRKEITTRFNETKERFDSVDRQLRLLDVDFSGIEEKMKHHDRDIYRLKNL